MRKRGILRFPFSSQEKGLGDDLRTIEQIKKLREK